MAWKFDIYLWRQSLVLFADYLHCVGIGVMLSFPSVLNPAILSPNSTDLRATPDQASWIAASQGFTGSIGFFIMPAIMQVFGRKTAHYGINLTVALGFLIIYFATNVTCLYIARLIQGLSLSGVYITSVILAEYSHPKRRGYFISIKKSAVAVGSILTHSMVMYLTWRQIALFGVFSNVFAIILTIFWPESPALLAMKGQFEKCDKAYTWLHGNSAESRKELEDMISAQTDRRKKVSEGIQIIGFLKVIVKKDFWKPFIITTLLTISIEACGRYYNFAYIVQIMTEIMDDKSIAVYFSMGSDILIVIALFIACFLITRFKRRTILFTFGFLSVFFMYLASLIIFLVRNDYIDRKFAWLSAGVILTNSFITNLGILPIGYTVSGEIFPLEHRATGTCVTGIVFTIFYSVVMKCTPIMIDKTGVEGTYVIYGFCLFISLLTLNYVMNETKDKTLQEIEDEIKGIKRDLEPILMSEGS